jgi:hypothetical protein
MLSSYLAIVIQAVPLTLHAHFVFFQQCFEIIILNREEEREIKRGERGRESKLLALD